MLLADLPLARRLERAAIGIESGYARTDAALRPHAGIEILPVADGVAIFGGIGCPMSQTTGLALDGPIAEADIDAVESLYFRRGANARIVVCPLADDSLGQILGRRGYRPVEFENTLVRVVGPDDSDPAPPPGIEVRGSGRDETERFIDVVGPSFMDDGVLPPALRETMRAISSMPDAFPYLALIHGEPAGGGTLLTHEGVAMLAGAATRPEYRNRGVHTAVFLHRLRAARERGCDLAVMGAKPGSGSQRNAERKGFRVAYTKVVFEKEPG